MFDFGIVIPCLKPSRHLATCLWSIVAQEGMTTAHIHVQDGGEGKEVQKLLRDIQKNSDSSRFTFTYVQERDKNAADAINRGMASVNGKMLTWIGSDDFFLPGAFEAVHSLRQQHPQIRWVTGLPHIVSESGVGLPAYGSAGFYRHPNGFSREGLRRGLHAGELNHGWIQQEGTFWDRNLWEAVEGVNVGLNLAFDFDLWCRMAQHTELFEVIMPLAGFRKHPGQASSDMNGYLEEAAATTQRAQERHPDHPRTRFIVQETWSAFLSKETFKWTLRRKKFILWLPRSKRPVSLPGGLTHVRFSIVRAIRSATSMRPSARLLLVVAGKIRGLGRRAGHLFRVARATK